MSGYILKIKQGETFHLEGRYLEGDGITPRSLIGVILQSQIRFQSQLIATLVVTVLDAEQGRYQITAPAGTAGWPVTTLSWDIRETVLGVDRFTETHAIKVERAITL